MFDHRWGLDQNPWFADPSYMGPLGPYFDGQLSNLQKVMRRYGSPGLMEPEPAPRL